MSTGNLLPISHSVGNLPVQVKRWMPFLSGHTLISSQVRKYLLCSSSPADADCSYPSPLPSFFQGSDDGSQPPSWCPGMRQLRGGGAWRKLEREEPLKNVPLA